MGNRRVKVVDGARGHATYTTEIRYGIWFTEGTETVQRFRDTIFKCETSVS